MTTPNEKIAVLTHRRTLTVAMGKIWADRIFQQMLQSDALADEVEDLMEFLYELDPDDPEVDHARNAELTDAVWASIMTQLHNKIRETQE